MSECQCGGAGFETLSNDDLLMLANIMKGRKDDVAKSTRMVVSRELFRRGVRNV